MKFFLFLVLVLVFQQALNAEIRSENEVKLTELSIPREISHCFENGVKIRVDGICSSVWLKRFVEKYLMEQSMIKVFKARQNIIADWLMEMKRKMKTMTKTKKTTQMVLIQNP